MSLCVNPNCQLMREHTPDECGFPVSYKPITVATLDRHYGRDCPKGKVQVEFVSIDPALRMSDYGWKPTDRATIDVWVDGERFLIEVGNIYDAAGHIVRGVHVISDRGMKSEATAVNSVTLTLDLPKET